MKGATHLPPRLHELWQRQQIAGPVLPHQLAGELLGRVGTADVHQRTNEAAGREARVLLELLVPRPKSVRLDDVRRVEGLGRRPVDQRRGADQHAVFDVRRAAVAAAYLQALEQLAQRAFVAAALLQRRRDAEDAFAGILDRELAVLVDAQAAVVVLGFQQVDEHPPRQHQVVDLHHLAVDLETQVVQQHAVGVVPQVVVEEVRRIALAGDAAFQAELLVAQPITLAAVQQRGLLQILEQREPLRLVVGGLDQHAMTSLVTFAWDHATALRPHTKRRPPDARELRHTGRANAGLFRRGLRQI